MFDRPFAEVASVLDTTEAATRQLVARARAHIDENRPRYDAPAEKKQELLRAFITACATQDATALGLVLKADVVVRSDGGGKVHAARKPILGRERVVRFLMGILEKDPPPGAPQVVWVNGQPGLVFRDETGTHSAVTLSIEGNEISDVWIVNNPDKLAHLTPRGT